METIQKLNSCWNNSRRDTKRQTIHEGGHHHTVSTWKYYSTTEISAAAPTVISDAITVITTASPTVIPAAPLIIVAATTFINTAAPTAITAATVIAPAAHTIVTDVRHTIGCCSCYYWC